MTKEEFKSKMRGAFQQLASGPYESAYYQGFMRGLRKAYHGESFGTEYQHEQWMSLADEVDDELRRAREEGYRDGLRGEPRPRGVTV